MATIDTTNQDANTPSSMTDAARQASEYSGTAGGTASSGNVIPPVPVEQQQVQPAAPQQPQQPVVVAPPPHSEKANMFRSLFEALAGPQTPTYKVNADTGQVEAQPTQPRSRRALANAIVAGALTGLLAGSEPGISRAQSLGAGYRAVTAQDQQQAELARQKAMQEGQFSQQFMLNKARIAETNMHLMMLQKDLHAKDLANAQKDKSVFDADVANYKTLADYAAEHNLIDARTQSGIDSDQLAKIGVKNFQGVGIPYGTKTVYGPDGKPSGYRQTYIVLKNDKADVQQADLDKINAWDMQGFDKMPPGTPILVSTLANNLHTVGMFNREQIMLNQYMDGLSKGDKADYLGHLRSARIPLDSSSHIDLKAFHREHPDDLKSALESQTKIYGQGGFVNFAHPWEEVDELKKHADTAPYANLIGTLYGGSDFFDKQREAIAARAAATKTAAEEAGKVGVIDSEARANAILSNAASTPEQKRQAQDFLDRQVGFAGRKAGAEEGARERAKSGSDADLQTPGILGDKTTLDRKEYNKRQDAMKKNVDELSKTEQTYGMFSSAAQAARNAQAGKGDMTGAQSVVTLFNAIGLSATPLKGMGFRINNNTVEHHVEARSLGQNLYARLLQVKAGDIITPQQVLDYTSIAEQARKEQYRAMINQARNAGLKPDFLMPRGNGRLLDANTRDVYLDAANNDPKLAAAAAMANGWRLR